MNGTSVQLELRPARHASQLPQEIWKGTLTSWPAASEPAASPASITSATHSCPSGNGAWKGEVPDTIRESRSQVATAMGRTRADSSEESRGSGASRHCNDLGPANTSCCITHSLYVDR